MAVALDFSSFLYSGTKYPMRFYFIFLHLSGEKRAILERLSELYYYSHYKITSFDVFIHEDFP